ncbi:hypothetical protein R3X27_16770 [Tropicimonas sp. TH_r6]|uniref:glycosyltransferase family 2 protein n=1 Tax=Tropicimonas sp. TH_r6 TaxID=3082085 RepID=UPI002954E816|nr:hypothetical protein [Tropicimonas sp. TH_r6]MDV7144336.1 hypothetical protein [Tropicimonas sp. TH_r6]
MVERCGCLRDGSSGTGTLGGMISVVTVSHKSYDLLSDYVESFLTHHSGRDALVQIEFVFIENSGDERIAEHACRLREAGFATRWELSENRGFGAGCNLGAALASGELLVFANPDMRFMSNICGLKAVFGTSKWGTVAQTGEDGKIYAFDLLPEYRSVLTELLRVYRFCHRLKALHRYVYPVGSFMVVPHAAFEATGGFDERFFLYYEEAELSRRLQGALGPPVLLPTIKIHHQAFGTQGSSDFTYEQEAMSMVTYGDVIGHPDLARRRLRMLQRLSFLSTAAGERAAFLERAIGIESKVPDREDSACSK